MGYNIDREFALSIPVAMLPAVLDVLGVDRFLSLPERRDDFVDAFIAAYNEDGDLALDVAIDDPDGVHFLTGSTWGKTRGSSDDTTTKLAHLGVTGSIDCRGEDESIWRERLLGGEVELHKGVVVYPSDHYPGVTHVTFSDRE